MEIKIVDKHIEDGILTAVEFNFVAGNATQWAKKETNLPSNTTNSSLVELAKETPEYVELLANQPTAEEQIEQRANQSEQQAKQKMIESLTMIEIDKVRSLPDDQAISKAEFFPAYRIGRAYETDDRFYYPLDEKLYKVLQPHTSAIEWKPDEAVSLYVHVAPSGVIPNWVQPTGAHDAYQTGDIVMYNAQAWISKIDANTTVPDGDEPFNRYWEHYNII